MIEIASEIEKERVMKRERGRCVCVRERKKENYVCVCEREI